MSYTYLCENSTCSPGQEAESLAECCSDTPRFALWKLNPTADASYSKDSGTQSCPDSPFGTTLPHSTATLGAGALTSSAEGFRAKTFPQPEKAQELTAHEADCGDTWPEWFAKFDRASSSWKTRQCSLLAGLDVFSGTWPRWGMMRGGVCWELMMLEHRTEENESGFWPTPCLPGNGGSHGKAKLKAMLWPTPTAVTDAGGAALCKWGGSGARAKLRTMVSEAELNGALNPNWVEWLMGWPIGWTDLRPLATDRCHSAPLSHGAPSQDSNP